MTTTNSKIILHIQLTKRMYTRTTTPYLISKKLTQESVSSYFKWGPLSVYHKITGYWITTRSFPYRANMGLDFVSGQYGCLFSRYRKYVINSLIHGHFHIDLVIIPRPILAFPYLSGYLN
jgi:hypothetical protein